MSLLVHRKNFAIFPAEALARAFFDEPRPELDVDGSNT